MYSIGIGVAVKSSLILGLAWLLARLLRPRSAAARHVVWTAALAAVLALPFLSVWLPALRVRTTAALWATPADAMFEASAAVSPAARTAGSQVHGSTTASSMGTPWRADWQVWLMLVWAAGFTMAFAHTLAACAAAWRLRQSARPFPDGALCTGLSRALGIDRVVEVREAAAGSMPMTFGLLRPAILVPSEAVEWDSERRRNVLLHELAHVRRGDAATHLLARAALNIYWWNPLAWMAWREFLKERERAADDLVLSAGARASEYAGHLLEVARTLQTGPAMGWAAVAMARRSQLEGRLRAILDSGVNRAAAGRASLLAAVLLAVALVAPLAAVRAQQSQTQAAATDGNAADAAIRAARSQNNYERLENAGNAAAQLRMYGIAHKLLDAALLIRAELFGEQSPQYGVGILKLAALENKLNHEQAAGELYTKAAHLLGEQPEAAPALIHLGITAIDKKDFPQAMEYFQHVRRLNPTQAGAAMMWMAVVEQRQQHMDEAEKLYQGALAIQDPKSVEAAITMEVYGQFLRKQGRVDQAGEMDTRAAAIQAANALSPVSHTGPAVYKASSAGVRPPSLVSKVEPEYSEEGRAAALEGTIIVGVVIGLDGLAHDARILSGLGLGLDEQAVEAIQQWRFKPGLKDGQPVPVAATIEVNWRLL